MHDLPPPKNVILGKYEHIIRRSHMKKKDTHKLEYTPGILASVTLLGSGFNHLSGFHSYASSPHTALFLFDSRIPMWIVVSFGTMISWISFPSLPWMGVERGITMASRVLQGDKEADVSEKDERISEKG